MNQPVKKDQLEKSIGNRFKLQPVAKGASGQALDDDWVLTAVTDASATLENTRTKQSALVGLDGIHSRFSDPARDTPEHRYGFLQLHVEIRVASDGSVRATLLPPPRTVAGASTPSEPDRTEILENLVRLFEEGTKLRKTYVATRGSDAAKSEVDRWLTKTLAYVREACGADFAARLRIVEPSSTAVDGFPLARMPIVHKIDGVLRNLARFMTEVRNRG